MDPQIINANDIITTGRVTADRDHGPLGEMIASIKEFGLIQPIVLSHLNGTYNLVAGGRRLAAIKRMEPKYHQLVKGRDWILRDETPDTEEGKLRLGSIELEENLRRKDMTWYEQIAAKKRLLDIMQKIHGAPTGGRPSASDQRAGVSPGFGVRKLAAMLGESPATVSQDLQLADIIAVAPQLKNASSKSVAQGQSIGVMLAAAVKAKIITPTQAATAQAASVKPLEYRVMVFVKDEVEQGELIAELNAKGYKTQAVIV